MENKFQTIVKEKSNEELLTMVYQFDEWDSEMLKAVELELQTRELLPDDITQRKKESIDKELEELTKGKEAGLAGQIFGWLGVLGIIGLIIGYNYAFSKSKSKYTGKEFYKYDEPSRENGRYIFYTSLIVFIIFFLYKLLTFRGNAL